MNQERDLQLELIGGCIAIIAIPLLLLIGILIRLGRVTLLVLDWALS